MHCIRNTVAVVICNNARPSFIQLGKSSRPIQASTLLRDEVVVGMYVCFSLIFHWEGKELANAFKHVILTEHAL
jgi:hypothetical protein